MVTVPIPVQARLEDTVQLSEHLAEQLSKRFDLVVRADVRVFGTYAFLRAPESDHSSLGSFSVPILEPEGYVVQFTARGRDAYRESGELSSPDRFIGTVAIIDTTAHIALRDPQFARAARTALERYR